MKTSNTALSGQYLRNRGWECCMVEQTIRGAGIVFKRDAFNFGDLLAFNVDLKQTALIQSCVGGDMANRGDKILANPLAIMWVMAGNKLFLHGWAKRGDRGARKLWTVRIQEAKQDGSKPLLVWNLHAASDPIAFKRPKSEEFGA